MKKIIEHDIFWSAILFFSLLTLSIKFFDIWFIVDDMACIYASTKNIFDMLFDRGTYLTFNRLFYTPLLPISFKLDFILFGLNPIGYHMHNLLATFLTGIMGYKVYRLYLPKFESWAGVFLFMLSYTSVTNIGWITRKHYLWGTLFILLSFYLFKKAEAKTRFSCYFLSYFSFMVALLFKEAFAIMPAVTFLLASGNVKERIIKSLPYFLLFGIYLWLRFYIIGGLGGYIYTSTGLSQNILNVIKQYVMRLDIISNTVWGLPGGVIALLFLFLAFLGIRISLVTVLLFGITLLPFLLIQMPDKVDDFFQVYFVSKFMMPVFLVSGVLAFMINRSKKLRIRLLAPAIASVLLILQILHARDGYATLKKYSDHYRTVSTEAIERSMKGQNILIIDDHSHFYFSLYNIYCEIFKEDLAPLISANNPIILSFKPDLIEKADYIWFDRRWIDPRKEGESSIRQLIKNASYLPPKVQMDIKGHFVTISITDNREVVYYGMLESKPVCKNILLEAAQLPKNKPLTIGVVEGEKIVFLYCEKNACSKPSLITP